MIEAQAVWTGQDCFIGTASSGHAIVVDAGKQPSGNGPMELVLMGLCSCTATDVVSILRIKREPFTAVEVRAQAERNPKPPSVYTSIHLKYRISGRISAKAAEDAVHLSQEKYCSVAAMLKSTTKITYELELDEAE